MSENISISASMSNSLDQLKKRDPRVFHYSVEETDLTRLGGCPICQSEDLKIISDVRLADSITFFETSVCSTCKFVFRSIFPNFEWFKKRWAQISTLSAEVFNPKLEAARKERYRAYHKILKPFVSEGGKVLDIGGGYGSGLSVFRDSGFDTELLEPEDDRVYYARENLGIKTHHTVLEEFEPATAFDLVLWTHNLEHVDNPRESFNRVMSLVKPDTGVLYLEVPLVWNVVDWSDSMFMAHKSNFAEAHLGRLVADSEARAVYKWYPRLNSKNLEYSHQDIGLVIQHDYGKGNSVEIIDDVYEVSLDRFYELYLRMMPCEFPKTITRPIHFEVPFINHFYTTIRYNERGLKFNPRRGVFEFER